MTDRYAVIGNPVSHSKSPLIHRLFAEQTRQDISYEAIEAPLDGFATTIERLRSEGYRGCNVTVPFKMEAWRLAGHLNPMAREASSVNTLIFTASDIVGDNTDGVGLVRDITQNLGFSLKNQDVLLLGAGGAAYGVALPLLHAGARLAVANRTADKARQLAATFAGEGEIHGCGYDDLPPQRFDAVINATSAGLSDSVIPLPPTLLAPGALAYDMMYGRETPFIAFARAQGAHVADGLGMLVEQAAEAFFIWRGVRPDTSPVLDALRRG